MAQKFILLFIFLFVILDLSCGSGHQRNAPREYYRVTRVIDGDTFVIETSPGTEERVRLIGVDAPETRRTRNREIGHYAEESKAFLVKMIENKMVRIEYDFSKHDRYQRILAYVYLRNGTFVNAELVKRGFAVVMTVPPNVNHADTFFRLQREARENNRGLWREQ
ncbi:MAG: thermonuclease family protein [Porphyromonadaceae bacterium]|nr:thermonuclease family protein [Porphyromonadaceae bacterium]